MLGLTMTDLQDWKKNSAGRLFSRSSFASARPYEARQQRPRRRTFIMADLLQHSHSDITMMEVDSLGAAADRPGGFWSAGEDLLKSIMGSAVYNSTASAC